MPARLTPLEKARRQLLKAQSSYRVALCMTQMGCTHPDIVECEYAPDRLFGGVQFPPMRVCKVCGMSEEGWSFQVLVSSGPVPVIPRNSVYKLRTPGLCISQEVQGPLRRKEVTVRELVMNHFHPDPPCRPE